MQRKQQRGKKIILPASQQPHEEFYQHAFAARITLI